MSNFEQEVKKAEQELEQQSLVPVTPQEEEFNKSFNDDEYLGDLKMQAQDYQQRFQDAAVKAKDFASEKFAQASGKFKELSNKEPNELLEEAKEFARQKPGQAIVVSAAVGLILGLLLRRK